MRKNNFLKIFWVLFYVFIFLFLLKNSYNYLDPDLGWHLKVGEQIITEKQAPSINYYNYTLNNKNWVDHEWLSNAGMYLLYKNFGYGSLNFLFALILLIALIILNIFTGKLLARERGAPFFIFLLQFLGLMAMLPHIGVRIQEITILNLLLLIVVIHRYERTKSTKMLFVLPPFFYFWACLHAGFLIGLFILAFWIVIRLAELFIKNRWNPSSLDFGHDLKIRHIKNFLLFSVLSALATMITPYGLELYSFLSGYKNTYYLKHIQEWLPIYYTPIMLWQLLYEALSAAAIVLLVSFSLKTKGREYKIDAWQMAVSALFLVLAMKSKRHFPLFFIASFPMMAGFFSSYLKIPRDLMLKKKSKPMLFVKIYIVAVLSLVPLTMLIKINFIRDPFASFCRSYPCEAVEFLKNNPQYHDLNIFNSYSWGGYLIWVWPEKQIFIDGRLPQYEFAGHTMLEEYHEFFNKDEDGIKSKLGQYNIGLVLLKKDKPHKLNWFEKYLLRLNQEKINEKENELENFLDNSNAWQKIYSGSAGNVYIMLAM
ncbi:hypothetical protein KKH38_04030 [Patescibacteria group bacterium]|nr:hypothetical protein [Patescibacteria group bacterium]MBU4600809.1 hypothetical protein [Patescibacteria group bacterium]MCG2697551.1 hypothetical protein [Candidatus Parcubacteria bacterium]